jgi:hypothetical protein
MIQNMNTKFLSENEGIGTTCGLGEKLDHAKQCVDWVQWCSYVDVGKISDSIQEGNFFTR